MISVTQKPNLRSTEKGPTELEYLIVGTIVKAEAESALLAKAPTTHVGKVRRSCTVESIEGTINTTHPARGAWIGTVPYTPASKTPDEPLDVGAQEFSFDTGSASANTKMALETVHTYSSSALTEEDYEGAIGVSGSAADPQVDGMSIEIPCFEFSIKRQFLDTEIDGGDIKNIFDLGWHVNESAYLGYPAYSLLFKNAGGSHRADEEWEITYFFRYSQNLTNYQPPSFVTLGLPAISKRGHDRLEFRYKNTVGNSGYLRVPHQIDVLRVREPGNFNVLKI